ncbi:MAG: hypothetical protein WBS24_03395 [Terriglobales bacterium]
MRTADVTTSYFPECVPCSWAGKRTVDEEYARVQALQHDRERHEISPADAARIRAWALGPVERNDVAEGNVWPEEIHGADCDGLCGEPGGCWEDGQDEELNDDQRAALYDQDHAPARYRTRAERNGPARGSDGMFR